jgi:hypothetical protein
MQNQPFESKHYGTTDMNDADDGDVVLYGPKNGGAGCGEPSFSIWMVPGTACEFEAAAPCRAEQFLNFAVDMFGPVARVRGERLMRFAEEAVELVHADGVQREVLEVIVHRVYERPRGHVLKEIGQAQATLETYAWSIGECADDLAEIEWARVQNIPREEWVRRHDAKIAIGMALPTKTPGQVAYEQDCEIEPCLSNDTHGKGHPRAAWGDLSDASRAAWDRAAAHRVKGT